MGVELSYMERVYSSLGAMDVALDPNPIEFGPGRLNNKVAEVRSLLSQTEKLFMEVSHNLHKYKRDLLVAETEYALEQTRLMADDPHVRSGRSQGEREALASTKLVPIQTRINDNKLAVHDLEDLLKIIKAKRTDLKDIQGRLKDQLKLCQEQLALGLRWGSKTSAFVLGEEEPEGEVLIAAAPELRAETPPRVLAVEPTDDFSIEDRLQQTTNLKPLPEASAPVNPSEIKEFLDTPMLGVKVSSVEAIDLDDLFDDFNL